MGTLSFSREPALTLIAVVGPAVALLVSYFGDSLGADVQTAINAVAVAAAGILTAVFVHGGDKLAPALLGLAQAVVTLGLAAGWDMTPEQQAGFLTVAGILIGAFVRTQVDAPVDALGQKRAGRHRLDEPDVEAA
jgi:hypothetical protein